MFLDKHRDADSELIIFLLSSDCSLCAGWPAFSLGFMSGSKAVIITERAPGLVFGKSERDYPSAIMAILSLGD